MPVAIKRREFITAIGGAMAAWPRAAGGQQAQRMRRIGALMNVAEDTQLGQPYIAAFREALSKLGWSDGGNLRLDVRWGGNDVELDRKYATELVGLAPDLLFGSGTLSVAALRHATHTLPIVFVEVSDPVGAGFIDSLARPGGNVTGFTIFEYGFSVKWLEVLKQIAPAVTRAAVLRDSANPAGIAQFGAIRAAASSLGVDVTPINVHRAANNAEEIERAVASFARSTNGGLIVTGSAATVHRDLIVTLADRYKLPSVYNSRDIVTAGGLVSYGPDFIDQYRQAAGYVDRVLKGEKCADLPVQAPTKYELVINMKTAKALGLDVPPQLLARADAVIE
jgi:putative ABC transport system substrate-binding protein